MPSSCKSFIKVSDGHHKYATKIYLKTKGFDAATTLIHLYNATIWFVCKSSHFTLSIGNPATKLVRLIITNKQSAARSPFVILPHKLAKHQPILETTSASESNFDV